MLFPRNPNTEGKYLPEAIWLNSLLLKNDLYDRLKLDRALPAGTEKANLWPSNRIDTGYTDGYFDELTAEHKSTRRLASGRMITEWTFKKGGG